MKTNGQDTPTAPKPRRKPHGPERLKPERVQLRIESLPGWTLRPGGRAIARYYALPDTAQALAFLDTVQALGRSQGRLPQVDLRADGAIVSLPTPRSGWIETGDYELALALGTRP
ncbi:MAG: Pterin 4 alpha carbinolamine dehydratase [Acidobacteriota bacterium]|jgi:pterin-4a-carbinolamine dehydratase|nr:Pterin 4 alpha carbinolamine dehydratase [Acidobacteriota bacterium]